jgi:hypothetical protein
MAPRTDQTRVKVTYNSKLLDLARDQLKELSNLRLDVGIQGKEARKRYKRKVKVKVEVENEAGEKKMVTRRRTRSIPVGTVALIQHYGSKSARIPPRPFLSHMVKVKKDKIVAEMRSAIARAILDPATPVELPMVGAGVGISRLAQSVFDNSHSWAKPNAPLTIKIKGFDYPLHATDQMSGSFSWILRKGKRKIREGNTKGLVVRPRPKPRKRRAKKTS